MGSKQTRSNTHEHRVLVDNDLQRVTWKEEASNPKPQTSLCPDTKAGNFEGMRRSSPTHVQEKGPAPIPSSWNFPPSSTESSTRFLYVPAHSCETSILSPATPTLPFPPTIFPLITFSFPASLFLRYSQLDKKPLSYGPASPADDEEYLQSQLSFGLILHLVHRYLLAFFLVRNFAKMWNLKMLCDHLKGFFWEFFL
jgi:hypothetical protein